MTLRILLLALGLSLCCASSPSGAFAQDAEKEKAAESAKAVEMGPTELDYSVDDRIKVKVEPFVPGTVVDRLIEPSIITVQGAPPGTDVELFAVPVDAPYGGKAIDRPHSIGKDEKPVDGWKVHWTAKEHHPYVKVFAVVHKKSGGRARSRTFDFGMSGARYEPEPETEKPVAP